MIRGRADMRQNSIRFQPQMRRGSVI